MAAHSLAQCVPQSAEQMPAISHLNSVWRPAPCSIGIKAGAIACDDLNPRIAPEPAGYAVRVAIGKQIQNAIALQIADDRSIALAAAPCPIIDADNGRGDKI